MIPYKHRSMNFIDVQSPKYAKLVILIPYFCFSQENLIFSLKSRIIFENSRFLNIDVASKIKHFGSNSIVLLLRLNCLALVMKHYQVSWSIIKNIFKSLYVALWRFLLFYDILWHYNASWCFMMLYYALWHFMMLYVDLWPLL